MTDIEFETAKPEVIEFLRIKCEILETENEGLKTNHEKYLNHLEIVIKENYKLRNERQKEILKILIENKELNSKLEMLEPENILLKLENEFFSNRYDKILILNKILINENAILKLKNIELEQQE